DVHKDQHIYLEDPKPLVPTAKPGKGRKPKKLKAQTQPIRVAEWAEKQPDDRWQRTFVRDTTKGKSMKKISVLIIALLFAVTLIYFSGCVTDQASLRIENGLRQNKLAYYNDSFDKIREDLWEKAGYLYSEEQVANFKPTDMRIANGKLIIKTKTGCFSKGGMSTKYAFSGDFDIQVDCHIDFLEGLHDMDHLIDLLVVDKSKELEATDFVKIGLYKRGTLYKSYIVSGYGEKGKYHRGKVREIGNFRGALRIFRSGNQISTFYKREGDKAWKKMNTFRSTPKDVGFGFRVQNFFTKRTYIKAKSPITAIFDNFRINAAHQIMEEDI
ncbi:MAG: hypothetical protein HQ547_04555, partial [Candidatus Omnitrophica bacterium]|nr:hypothetical protein [Candidatus Omnitrophota bacterium]